MIQIPSASWRATAIAAAFGVLFGAAHLDAHALALGRLTTLSALGEPLRAEIDIPEINAGEFASFKATMATPEDFKAAGLEYNPALASTQFTLQRRTDGTAFLQLRSDKAVSDPFVNLMVAANWANGRIVRNFTLLLDPPTARQNEVATSTAPITAPMAPLAAPKSAAANTNAPSAGPLARPNAETKPAPTPVQKQPAVPAPTPSPGSSGEQLKVASGDTALKIAANNRVANVSLDQMLIAMLRGNPQAFIGNNINRLKAGAVLSLPSSEEAQAIPGSVARQNVIAQSKDFNNFRRKLAENAPGIASKAPDRLASGKIEAKVEDRKPAAVAPDKLTLSKGSLNGDAKAGADAKDNSEKIARDRQARDDASRVAELSKNIGDLNKIASSAAVSPAPPAVIPTTPAATPVSASNAAPGSTTPPPAAVTKVKPVLPAKPAAAPAAPVAEARFMDGLMDSPAALPAAGVLLALLAAGGLYVALKRKNRGAEEDDEDAEGEFEDQSFFHTTHHEPLIIQDTVAVSPTLAAAPAPSDSPALTLPPLPIALAPPTPPAPTATEATPVTEADVYIPQEPEPADTFPAMTAVDFSERTVAQLHPESAKSPAPVDLDLDFDFDFSTGFPTSQPSSVVAADTTTAGGPDFAMASATSPEPESDVAPAAAAAPHHSGMIEFDLASLSLDLNASNNPTGAASAADSVGPLETKLALAQEFRAIGDSAGAKMLVQEVIAQASGSLKTKAENLLAELG